jgi:hypothetical protein
MRIVKTAAIAALLSCSLMTPVTPAYAEVLPAPSQADMLAVCTADMITSLGYSTTDYRVAVQSTDIDYGPDTAVAGSEYQLEGSKRADLTSVIYYAGFTKAADPLVRIGGSPNLWGQAAFTEKYSTRTLVDVWAKFERSITYEWTCAREKRVVTLVESGPNNDNIQNGGNQQGNNGCGNGNTGPNSEGKCVKEEISWVADGTEIKTQDGGTEARPDAFVRTDSLAEPFLMETGTFLVEGVYALACISPGSKGGTWRAKEYYTGGNCSTATFNAASTVAGRTFDPIASNSLPAN